MVHIDLAEAQRTVGEIRVRKIGLRVRLPGDRRIGIYQLGDQVCGRGLTVETMPIFLYGKAVVQDAEVRSCFEPQVIRQTGMVARRVEVLLGMRPQRNQAIDIRNHRAPLEIRVTR